MYKSLHTILLSVVLFNFEIHGQPAAKSTGPGRTPEAVTALSNQRKHALWTLVQLFGISRGLPNQAARIRIGGQIADILWDHDQPRAREYFTESLHQLDSGQSGNEKDFTAVIKAQLRRELMGMIARRDPAMAQRLLLAYKKSERADPVDLSLDPEIATNMASRDLQRAVALLRPAMAGGITPELITSLRVIREVAPGVANDLFYEAMAVSVANDSEAFGKSLPLLASYAFDTQSHVASSLSARDRLNSEDADNGNASAFPENPVAPAADMELINNFLNFAFQALLLGPEDKVSSRGPSGPGLPAYAALMQLMPYYQQYLPEQASVIVSGFNRLAAAIRDPAKRALLVNLVGQVSPNQIVQGSASLAKSDEKDIVYHRASLQASRQGDFERALSIAGSIQDEKLRQDAESVARTESVSTALSRGDFDAAHVSIMSIPLLGQRVAMFAQMVRALLQKNNTVRAEQILDEATRFLEKAHDTPDKARGLLLLFEIGTQIDDDRGTTILQMAVAAMNASAWTDGDKGNAISASALPGGRGAEATSKLFGLNFHGSFALLARTDFDTALALAQSIRQQELSVRAQLAACQGILALRDRRLPCSKRLAHLRTLGLCSRSARL